MHTSATAPAAWSVMLAGRKMTGPRPLAPGCAICPVLARRVKTRDLAGLSDGSPLTQPDRDTPAAAEPKPFLEHWERVEIPKPSATFDGAEAGTEGVVRIIQPAKQAGKRTSKAGSAKASLRASIPVTFAF